MAGTKRRPRRRKTSKAILHCAKQLFEKKGPENVTILEVAQAAGVSRTTVFNHFGDTKGLLRAIGEEELDAVRRFCGEKERKHEPDVRDVFEILVRDATYYPALMLRIITASVLERGKRSVISEIEQMILDRTGGDEFRMLMLSGAYYGLLNHRYVRGLPFEADDMMALMDEMIAKIMD